MKNLPLPKVGLRTLKTALAVFLCLLLFPSEPFFACMTAVFCLQDTVANSFKFAFIRGVGTLFGGIIGLIFLLFCKTIRAYMPPAFVTTLLVYLVTALGIIVVIYFLNLIHRQPLIPIACIVFLAITTVNAQKMPLNYTLNRVIETYFGILVALFVNRFVTPPKPEVEE